MSAVPCLCSLKDLLHNWGSFRILSKYWCPSRHAVRMFSKTDMINSGPLVGLEDGPHSEEVLVELAELWTKCRQVDTKINMDVTIL